MNLVRHTVMSCGSLVWVLGIQTSSFLWLVHFRTVGWHKFNKFNGINCHLPDKLLASTLIQTLAVIHCKLDHLAVEGDCTYQQHMIINKLMCTQCDAVLHTQTHYLKCLILNVAVSYGGTISLQQKQYINIADYGDPYLVNDPTSGNVSKSRVLVVCCTYTRYK